MFHGKNQSYKYMYTKICKLYCCLPTFPKKGCLWWVLLHIRGTNFKFHSLFLQGKWLVWLERKLISAHQQPYGGRSGLSQSNPKDCVWLIILKHNPQISKFPPLLRFIPAMTKVIMTRDEEKNLFTNPITQRILSSKRWGVAKVARLEAK